VSTVADLRHITADAMSHLRLLLLEENADFLGRPLGRKAGADARRRAENPNRTSTRAIAIDQLGIKCESASNFAPSLIGLDLVISRHYRTATIMAALHFNKQT
jgi:hypothetical protein